MKTVDKEKLWEAYRKKPSQELREQLIIEYSQLVTRCKIGMGAFNGGPSRS